MVAQALNCKTSREAIDYSVVKMNIDTDTQYAFTRAIADHMLKNYNGVLKVDGEMGIRRPMIPNIPLPGRVCYGRSGQTGGE